MSLVTVSDAKDHLNIPSTDTSHDTKLQGFIDAADAVITYLTGPVEPTSYTEVHSGGGPTIVLLHPPVISVQSVTEYVGPTAYTLTQAELGQSAGAYSFSLDDPEAGIIARRYTGGLAGNFAGGYRNVAVTYTAGRTTTPADIRMAVLEDLRGLYQQTQMFGRPPFSSSATEDDWSPAPMHLFPRLSMLLDGPSRTPSIA